MAPPKRIYFRNKRKRDKADNGNTSSKKVRWNQEDCDSEPEIEENITEVEDNDKDEGDEREICLTVTCLNGKLGAAYYSPSTSTLYLVEDTAESAHFDLAKMLLEQANPDVVFSPSRADEDFLAFCRESTEKLGGKFQVRPHREFMPGKGRDKMLSLAIFAREDFETSTFVEDDAASISHSVSVNAYNFMRRQRAEAGDPTLLRHHALIRLANYSSSDIPLCMSAVGALLDHLARVQAVGDLDHEGIVSLDIQRIEILALDQVMQINADALSSLQVFDDESHASMHSNRSKEGLSLFGILDFTKTNAGRTLLRQWCIRPLLSIPEIEARHDAVACFIRGENTPITDAMHGQLKGFKNAPRAFTRIKSGKGATIEWRTLVTFAYHVAMLMEALSDLSHTQDVPIIEKFRDSVDSVRLQEMGRLINERIDWETSENERRTCIRHGIDEELDKFKHAYYGLDQVLSRTALKIKKEVPPDSVESLNVLYFPQLGYLICVPRPEELSDPADFIVVEGWNCQFYTATSIYYKDEHMYALDEHFGDLHTMIAAREIELLHQLEQEVLHFEQDVRQACDVGAELDVLLSFATASRAYEYVRPRMVEENILHVKAGRHPLVERLADVFVPNDMYLAGGRGGKREPKTNGEIDSELGEEEKMEMELDSAAGDDETRVQVSQSEEPYSVAIVTGPNACGKSVYLKQNALIPFMAQIGCFVPADSATLGIVDKIFTRLQTRESVSKLQSSFMIDLNQVSLALRNATPRSLVLLDEFGNGTTPTDGASIFYAVIRRLLSLESESESESRSLTPKVLVATHFHEALSNNLLGPGSGWRLAYLHVEAMLSKGREGGGTLIEIGGATLGSGDGDESGVDSEADEQVEIHYLYRVAKGLSLNSYASKCALMYGMPPAVVARAEYISELFLRQEFGQLLDEGMTGEEQKELDEAEAVCRGFVAWDPNKWNQGEDVKEALGKVLGTGDGV
ncbi:hypothetical protein DL93DRAFT_760795 [Clavulina sp. PMI_390]|nr:hypothetical protein DL93DRAFT_760795 [Clavulina sp. PMI_390]